MLFRIDFGGFLARGSIIQGWDSMSSMDTLDRGLGSSILDRRSLATVRQGRRCAIIHLALHSHGKVNTESIMLFPDYGIVNFLLLFVIHSLSETFEGSG